MSSYHCGLVFGTSVTTYCRRVGLPLWLDEGDEIPAGHAMQEMLECFVHAAFNLELCSAEFGAIFLR